MLIWAAIIFNNLTSYLILKLQILCVPNEWRYVLKLYSKYILEILWFKIGNLM